MVSNFEENEGEKELVKKVNNQEIDGDKTTVTRKYQIRQITICTFEEVGEDVDDVKHIEENKGNKVKNKNIQGILGNEEIKKKDYE